MLNIHQEIWLSFHKNISMLQNKLQSEMSWKKCFFGSIKIEHFCVIISSEGWVENLATQLQISSLENGVLTIIINYFVRTAREE